MENTLAYFDGHLTEKENFVSTLTRLAVVILPLEGRRRKKEKERKKRKEKKERKKERKTLLLVLCFPDPLEQTTVLKRILIGPPLTPRSLLLAPNPVPHSLRVARG